MGRQVGGELGPVGSRGSGRVWLVICIAFVVTDIQIQRRVGSDAGSATQV